MNSIKSILESLIFASSQPLTEKQLQQLFPDDMQPEIAQIKQALLELSADYENHAIELKQVASGYRFQIRADYAPWLVKLLAEKPAKYSRALLETLAIIAYRQPVTRGDIEDIRGVSVSSSIMQTLIEREWIRIIGQKEVAGRPSLYATTPQFLDYFNLQTLSDLPALQTIPELELTE
ncbi:MAG: SMC-Scp complex subunit ScpB [Methylococcales bacterium]|nr:SMC-Scp complex subunit ScpB [Methylococcales bacterium]